MGLLEVIDTPERREQSRRQQEKLREKFGARLAQRTAESNYLYGLAREQQALDQLRAVAGDAEKEARLFDQLAEGLALQARFAEAADLAQSPGYKAEYRAKAEALTQIGVNCQCPRSVVTPSPVDAKGVTTPAQQALDRVYDGRAEIAFYKCLLCKTISAQIG